MHSPVRFWGPGWVQCCGWGAAITGHLEIAASRFWGRFTRFTLAVLPLAQMRLSGSLRHLQKHWKTGMVDECKAAKRRAKYAMRAGVFSIRINGFWVKSTKTAIPEAPNHKEYETSHLPWQKSSWYVAYILAVLLLLHSYEVC